MYKYSMWCFFLCLRSLQVWSKHDLILNLHVRNGHGKEQKARRMWYRKTCTWSVIRRRTFSYLSAINRNQKSVRPTTRRGDLRVNVSDRWPVTAGLRFRYTGPVWPITGRNRWNSNLNSNFPVQPVPTGIPAGLAGISAGLDGNRPVWLVPVKFKFFSFLFKFKCPQSILNKCLYNIF